MLWVRIEINESKQEPLIKVCKLSTRQILRRVNKLKATKLIDWLRRLAQVSNRWAEITVEAKTFHIYYWLWVKRRLKKVSKLDLIVFKCIEYAYHFSLLDFLNSVRLLDVKNRIIIELDLTDIKFSLYFIPDY